MLTYEPGNTVFHRLDPRSKLVGQVGFAAAAITAADPATLVGLTVLVLVVLALARLSPVRLLRAYWFVLVFLGLAPLFATLHPGPPWVVPGRALPSVVAGYQVVLVLFVAAAYVRTTPVRETRAAVQRHVPGRPGQLLGVGMALVFRLFPVLFEDVRRTRLAVRARGGDARSTRDRVGRVSRLALGRALSRAETLSLALQARCFAWNPTLPVLRFSRLDYPVLAAGAILLVSPVVL